ncbi:PREDICTED: uncharacterized protein LOC104800500 [Tarenaya hassleriana]|uniref:uncharacterized protein LOC104800500 n=1 Tax=Tarenaya hassleriana TaxID=28532 RepID=UPI00053CA464|nr:PREDICTED: uncharacterized protein LOC104800500 [Tarenaya hassleriana]
MAKINYYAALFLVIFVISSGIKIECKNQPKPNQDVGPACVVDSDCDDFCGGPDGGQCDLDAEVCHCVKLRSKFAEPPSNNGQPKPNQDVGPACVVDSDCDDFCGSPGGGQCDLDAEVCHCVKLRSKFGY